MKVFYEFGLKQINKRNEEICGDSVAYSLKPGTATLVMSDGLGSGVKANILSTLTTRIATRLLEGGLPLEEVVETVSETLPICRVRKIAYSTFSMAQLFGEGRVKLVEYDNPSVFFLRDSRVVSLACQERAVDGKRVKEYAFSVRPGDWLVFVSDGVLNAGIGGAYPLGWGWEEAGRYLEGHVHDSLTADAFAAKVAAVVGELYAGPPGDDVSIAVVKVRLRRFMTIFTGPPVRREDDARIVKALTSAPGRHVVCGGTASRIVARVLGRRIDVDVATGTDDIRPAGRIEVFDLVSEGVLTLRRTLDILREGVPSERLKLHVDGASALVVCLREADEIHILAGRAMNPAHQNPNLPRELALKTQVVNTLADELRRIGKDVAIEYF